MPSAYTMAREAWERHLNAIVSKRYYANYAIADNYFNRHVAPVWCRMLGLPANANVERELRITPVMKHLILISARGHRRRHVDHKAPAFKCWPPFSPEKGKGQVTFFQGSLPVSALARLTGYPHDTVHRAIRRLRDGKKDNVARIHKLFAVLPLPTGHVFDVVLRTEDAQLSFNFPLLVYNQSLTFMTEARVNDMPCKDYVEEWAEHRREHDAKPGIAKAGADILFPFAGPSNQQELLGTDSCGE